MVQGGGIWSMYLEYMYENTIMKLIEIVVLRGGEIRENDDRDETN
jgi:hypothetical protein